jgi:hypothetical protein
MGRGRTLPSCYDKTVALKNVRDKRTACGGG